ncbi:MAG: type II secretion system GspH family protein [Defluviitaleaceae bacterium]|nr:type II secretion system GspH family protein [Defluviitaleaceae bacterium]
MKKKTSRGFSLLEAVIALSIWMILSLSVFFIWQHVSERGTELLAQQNAFENARVALDALISNTEMARTIDLRVGRDSTLQRITLWQRAPDGNVHDFRFDFDVNAHPTNEAHFQRLRFGLQEIARGIAQITVQPIDGQRLLITVTTSCDYPIVLEGSVDIRYKNLR